MYSQGILEVDIHGMNQYQAKVKIQSVLNKCNSSTYIVRIIHGYHNGTVLRNMIRREFRTHPKVLRVELSMNQGITDLIIRDL